MLEQSEKRGKLTRDEVTVVLGDRLQEVKQATVKMLTFTLSEIVVGF